MSGGKLHGLDDSKKNFWLCICDPTFGQRRGRIHHKPTCPRARWSTDVNLPTDPTFGLILELLQSALPRQGRFQWNGRTWIPIEENNQPLDGKALDDPRRATTKRGQPAVASSRNVRRKTNDNGDEICNCGAAVVLCHTHNGQAFYGCKNFPPGCGYRRFGISLELSE